MHNTSHKSHKNWSKFVYSTGGIIVLTAVMVFLLQGYIAQWQRKSAIQNEVASLEKKQNDISSANNQLEDNLKFLGSSSYKAKVARSLNMKIEGEEVVIFPDNFRIIKTAAATNTNTVKEAGNPSRWWRYFFGKNS